MADLKQVRPAELCHEVAHIFHRIDGGLLVSLNGFLFTFRVVLTSALLYEIVQWKAALSLLLLDTSLREGNEQVRLTSAAESCLLLNHTLSLHITAQRAVQCECNNDKNTIQCERTMQQNAQYIVKHNMF